MCFFAGINCSHQQAVSDWDAYEAMWEYNLQNQLKVNSAEHNFILAEHELTTKADREKICELMFEKFKAPAIFTSKQSVLTW